MVLSTIENVRDKVRLVILDHAGIHLPDLNIDDDIDLYRAGMKSFASVQLMLALEDTFEVEFPESMLTRATFRSPAAIERAVQTLKTSSGI
jgi:acyl carrier protein